jgi:hypothetical protein
MGFGLVVEDTTVSFSRRQGSFVSGNDVVFRRNTMIGSGSTDDGKDHQIYFSHGERWLIEDVLFDGQNGIHPGVMNNFAAKIRDAKDVVFRRVEAIRTRNGFQFGGNDDASEVSSGILLEKCISHDSGANGQSSGMFLKGFTDIEVRNCIFYNINPNPNSGGAAVRLWSDNYGVSGTIKLYNNVFYGNDLPDVRFESSNYNVIARNNIFYKLVNTEDRGFYRVTSGALANVDSDDNSYYWVGKSQNDLSFAIGQDSDLTSSFVDWQGLGKDVNSNYVTQSFVNPGSFDFHLQSNTQAIDSGIQIDSVINDYDNNMRPQDGDTSGSTEWDLGPYEFTG